MNIYFIVNERVLGVPRAVSRPKSLNPVSLQNRTILDIRAIQAPVATSVILIIHFISIIVILFR